MSLPTAGERLDALKVEFGRMASRVPGLAIISNTEMSSTIATGGSCLVQLRYDGGPEVVLIVETTRAELIARSGTQTAHAGQALIRDQLMVDLSKSYGWDDAECADASELAHFLFKHMLRRHKAASELEPER